MTLTTMASKVVQRVRVIDAYKGAWYDEAIGVPFNVVVDEVYFPGLYLAQINAFYNIYDHGMQPDNVFGIRKEHCIILK